MKSILCLISLALGLSAVAAEPPVELGLGKPAPDFSLPGIDGKTHRLADFKDARILVLIFTCNHCPDARAAAPRMAELDARYREKGVVLVAISGNDDKALRPDELGYSPFGDSFAEMKPFAEENGWRFPYLYDGDAQKVTRAYGAQATPHVFIFDEQRVLRYRGRIDDMKRKFGPLGESQAVNAIDALLAGREVKEPSTRAFGCSTKWSDKRGLVAEDQKRWEALEVKLDTLDVAGAKALAKNDTQKLRIVNFWSTTCGPCIAEFPDLVDTYRRFQNRPVELITISLDPASGRAAVEKFLKEQHAALSPRTAKSVEAEGRTTNNYLYQGNPDQLADAMDPKWGGALPLTLIIAPGGKQLWRSNGEIDALELRRQIVKWLDQQEE